MNLNDILIMVRLYRKVAFQASFFKFYVSLKECKECKSRKLVPIEVGPGLKQARFLSLQSPRDLRLLFWHPNTHSSTFWAFVSFV